MNFSVHTAEDDKSPVISFEAFKSYLQEIYNDQYEILVYSAAFFPGEKHTLSKISLKELAREKLKNESTLILPPVSL